MNKNPFIMDLFRDLCEGEDEDINIEETVDEIEDILFDTYSESEMDDDYIYEITEELEEYLYEYFMIVDILDKDISELETDKDVIEEKTEIDTLGSGGSSSVDDVDIDKSLQRIESYKGGLQRTLEWHQIRHNMLTASIASKVMNVDAANKKGLVVIREKLIMPGTGTGTGAASPGIPRPGEYGLVDDEYDVAPTTPGTPGTRQVFTTNIPSNPDAPNVRGNRYEPIIRNIYSRLNDNVEIGEYECIPHTEYTFIGASPDGIIMEGKSRGKMIEIKCPQPDSAIKDGKTVRDEYWLQIQVQLNVCNLLECDYVRAVVYDSDTIPGIRNIIRTQMSQKQIDGDEPKILSMGTVWMDGNKGEYVYEPPGTFIENDEIYTRPKTEAVFIRHYIIMERDWLVLNVKRNRKWFEKIYVPKAIYVWNEILEARKNPSEWMEKHPVNRRIKNKNNFDNTICVFKEFGDD
jgi:hypothetical protein